MPNTGNGTYDNGYWVVTTPDGTQYFFGKNKGPGWATGDPVTNSAFTEPVYGAHSGDPCFSSSGFSSSSCTQAWRWNLDFVIDPNGNAMAYYYHPGDELLRRQRRHRPACSTSGAATWPGSTTGCATRPARSTARRTRRDQVVFNADQRCIPTPRFACTASQFTSANAANWPDTPFDQQCLSGRDLQQPRADVLVADADRQDHDPVLERHRRTCRWTQYVVRAGILRPQGDPELILNSITRTGFSASGTSLALPPVQLSYQLMDNRIPGVQQPAVDGALAAHQDRDRDRRADLGRRIRPGARCRRSRLIRRRIRRCAIR